MTGQQFLDFLCGKSGTLGILDKNPDDTAFRNFMLDALNLTLKDISNRQQNWHWRWLEKTATASTVANQLDYDLPSDIDTTKIFAVFDRTNNIKYRYVEHDRFLEYATNPALNTGASCYWTIWANNLKLYPVPDEVRTIYIKYIKTITALADNSGTTDVPSKYDSVIIDGALRYAYQLDPELGNRAEKISEYEKGLLLMISDNNIMIDNLGYTQSHRSRSGSPLGDTTNSSPLLDSGV